MENLVESILRELNRNRELLEIYKSIPTGAFGALMIQNAITYGEKAMGGGDVIEMLRAFDALKSTK